MRLFGDTLLCLLISALGIKEGQAIIEKHGFKCLPAEHTLRKLKHYSLVHAIYKYHGRIVEFRETLAKQMGQKTETEQLEGLLLEYVK